MPLSTGRNYPHILSGRWKNTSSIHCVSKSFSAKGDGMQYRLYRPSAETRVFTEPFSMCRLPYRTRKSMQQQYPDGTFTIIGEIGSRALPSERGDTLLTDAGISIPILPRGSLCRPFEWIKGYIAVDENTYVEAVRSLFSLLFWKRRRYLPLRIK